MPISQDGGSPPVWRWFIAWIFVGAMAGGVLAAAFAGLLLLPVAGIAALLLTRSETARSSVTGVVAGIGGDFLAVAYLNRRGPGEVCTVTPSSGACLDEFNPLPWLVIGVVLVIAGVLAFLHTRRAGPRRNSTHESSG